MVTKKADKAGADAAALQKLIDELRAQLAAATAGTAVAELEAEKAALVTQRDQATAALAEISAKLETSIAERTRLAWELAAAQSEIRDLQNAGAHATKHAEPAPTISGPAISVRTKPGRQLTRYRAGRAFGPEAVIVELAELSPEQLQALQSDAELIITDHKPSQEA